jgi:hypothetical protein
MKGEWSSVAIEPICGVGCSSRPPSHPHMMNTKMKHTTAVVEAMDIERGDCEDV